MDKLNDGDYENIVNALKEINQERDIEQLEVIGEGFSETLDIINIDEEAIDNIGNQLKEEMNQLEKEENNFQEALEEDTNQIKKDTLSVESNLKNLVDNMKDK